MLTYYIKLGFSSLTRSIGVSAIAILAIGLGVGVSTSMTSLHNLLSRNPLPEKSDVIFNVRTDGWDPNQDFFGVDPGDPPKAQTYRDMTALMENDITTRETGVANAIGYAFPPDDVARPYQAVIRLCHSDFFPMFNVPFAYGAPWSDDIDRGFEPVVVLSQRANDRIFGGENSVGRTLRLGERQFTVIGVLARFEPMPMVYDCVNSVAGTVRDFFVPFDAIRGEDTGLGIWGNTDGWGPNESFDGDNLFTVAEFYWLQHWVQLEPGKLDAYKTFVDSYVMEQKRLGRFPRPLNNRVQPIMDWVASRSSEADVTRVVMIISILFLAVCAANLSGLLLSKFHVRASVIGVHRALGASRRSIFFQHLVECELIGLVGGTIGIGIAFLALRMIAQLLKGNPSWLNTDAFTVNGFSAAVAFAFALLAGMLSGLYPAWRAGRIAPAAQIKV